MVSCSAPLHSEVFAAKTRAKKTEIENNFPTVIMQTVHFQYREHQIQRQSIDFSRFPKAKRSNEISIDGASPSSHIYHFTLLLSSASSFAVVSPQSHAHQLRLCTMARPTLQRWQYRFHINENLSMKVRFNQVCINVSKAPTPPALRDQERKRNAEKCEPKPALRILA